MANSIPPFAKHRSSPMTSETRASGFTVLELVVALAIGMVLLGAAGSSLTALADGARDTTLRFSVANTFQTVRKVMNQDLQMVDAIRVDGNGQPYIAAISHGDGASNALVFRRVTGVTSSEEGLVEFSYGDPVTYYVESETLWRKEGAESRLIATGIGTSHFAVSSRGVVSVRIQIVAGRGANSVNEDVVLNFVPRNTQL
jgi:type II secretory pathway component PulJ